jgi:hypothetical protein
MSKVVPPEVKAKREKMQRSYQVLLRRACHWVNPRLILEWGPGFSTSLMAEECPAATILSIEHHPKWLEVARRKLGDGRKVKQDEYGHMVMQFRHSRIALIQRALSMKGGHSQGYITWPLYLKGINAKGFPDIDKGFELVFVDGRARFDCLVTAKQLLAPGGVVVLHDAQRENYQPAWKLFSHVFYHTDDRTAVMSDSPMPFTEDPKARWCREAGVEETLTALKAKLGSGEAFFYTRFGDADIFFIDNPRFDKNKRHQPKTPRFAEELKESFTIDDPAYMIALAAASGWGNSKAVRILRIANRFWKRASFWNAVALHTTFLKDFDAFVDFVDMFKERDVCLVGGHTVCQSELVRQVFNVKECVELTDTNAYDRLDQKMDEIRAVVGRHRTVVSALGQSTRILAKRLWAEGIRDIQYFDVGSTVDALAGVRTRSWIRKHLETVEANCNKLKEMRK